MVQRLAQWVIDGPQLGRMRADALAMLLLHSSSAYLYGRYWPVLAAQLALRGLLLSLMDNAFHYGTPLNSGREARTLALPAWAARGWLHSNRHHDHHLQPSLPWPALARMEGPSKTTAEPFWSAVLRQFRGPIPLSRLEG
jgi:fatty acid desaturase